MPLYAGFFSIPQIVARSQIFLSFGEIEWMTYHALVRLPRDPIFDTASNLPFGKRIELLK